MERGTGNCQLAKSVFTKCVSGSGYEQPITKNKPSIEDLHSSTILKMFKTISFNKYFPFVFLMEMST